MAVVHNESSLSYCQQLLKMISGSFITVLAVAARDL